MEKVSGYQHQFNIYEHPSLGLEAVKIGISVPALLFGIVWILTKKQWDMAMLWIFLFVIFINTTSVSWIPPIGYLFLWLFPAFKGNEWREINLSKRGYELLDTTKAETPDAAIAKFVRRNATNAREEINA